MPGDALSGHRDIAGWCEGQGAGVKVAHACWPSSVADYPANAVELVDPLVSAALEAALSSRPQRDDAPP